ncbi:unnamed protein product [Ilex paraguariensis]|uniref:Uncharacterized protein n=1 Tax=Ilex paraguariensis TaxID=185542 RepID=A0ABC8RNH2_9AQUA
MLMVADLWYVTWVEQKPLRALIQGPLNTGEEDWKMGHLLSQNGTWNLGSLPFVIPEMLQD